VQVGATRRRRNGAASRFAVVAQNFAVFAKICGFRVCVGPSLGHASRPLLNSILHSVGADYFHRPVCGFEVVAQNFAFSAKICGFSRSPA